jgi:hypothetical protein
MATFRTLAPILSLLGCEDITVTRAATPARKRLSRPFRIEAYRRNHEQGEGCATISGYGSVCSRQTAEAAIRKRERLLKGRAAQ